MQSNYIRVMYSTVVLIIPTIIISNMSEAQQPNSIKAQLEAFLYSDEFKASEMTKLRSLPIDSVEVLTKMLDNKKIGEQDEMRIFQCLAVKFVQFEKILPQAQKDLTVHSLQTKLRDPLDPNRASKTRTLENAQSAGIVNTLKLIREQDEAR